MSDKQLNGIKNSMPELPDASRNRLMTEFGLDFYYANVSKVRNEENYFQLYIFYLCVTLYIS